MPIPFGIMAHSDTSHITSAKRDRKGGVAGIGDYGDIFRAQDDHSQLTLHNNSLTQPGFNVWVESGGNAVNFLYGCYFFDGAYRTYSDNAGAWRIRYDYVNREIHTYFGNGAPRIITWAEEELYQPEPAFRGQDGNWWYLKHEEQLVQMVVGDVTKTLTAFQSWKNTTTQFFTILISGTFTGPLVVSLGKPLSAQAYIALAPASSGVGYTSDDQTYGGPSGNERPTINTNVILLLNSAILTGQMDVLVRRYYWSMEAPTP